MIRIADSSVNAFVNFVSTDKGWLDYKLELCRNEGIVVTSIGTQKSGYGGKKTIYKFSSRVNQKLTEVYRSEIDDIIKDLDELDLIMWFVDDGSWHKKKRTMHLYCNMLDDREVELLSDKIEEMFGIRPTKRIDRKRDGREFNYLYFPRKLVALFRPLLKDFLISIGLESLYYKFGGLGYKDDLESLIHLKDHSKFDEAYRSFTSVKRVDEGAYFTVFNGILYVNWIHGGKYKQNIFAA